MLKRFITLAGQARGAAIWGCVLSLLAVVQVAKAAVPSVVAVSASTYATGLNVQGKTVVDSSGNVFSVDFSSGNIWEIPVGGGAPTKISGAGGGGLAIDSANNLYVTNTYGDSAYMIPYSNGSYNTGAEVNLIGNFGSLNGYYMFVGDVAVDKSGHAFISEGSCCQSGSPIFEVNVDGTNPTLLVGNLAKPAVSLAVDQNQHLYYADGSNVYVVNIAASTPTSTQIGSGFSAPGGVSVDAVGNLYVADGGTSSIYVIPYENGAVNPADQFLLESGLTGYANYAPGVDGAGNLYLGNGYANNTVNKLTIGGLSFGSAAVGAPVSGTLSFFFHASVTPTTISLLQGTGAATEFVNTLGSSCVAGTTYTAGQSCTVQATMTAGSTGVRSGAVVLANSLSQVLATGYLSGNGVGAGLTVDPGTQTALTGKSPWNTPSAIAMDSAGNYYVADSGSNSVQVISSAGTATVSIGSGLSKPGGVAVDPAGNVYIADTGNGRVVMVPNINGTLSSSKQSVVVSSLSSPLGLAVDSDGAIYIADSGNKRVLRVPTFGGTTLETPSVVGSGYTNPVGLAVDGNGNLYVSDQAAGVVFAINLSGGSQTSAITQLNSPTAIGLDAAGSLYVVNSGNSTVLRLLKVNGGLTAIGELALGTGLSAPSGVAVNGAGNVAIADAGKAAVYSLQRTSGSLPMGSVNIALSGTPQTVSVTSAGTAAATLGAPAYVSSGNTADFTVTSPASGGCTASQSLAVGTSCTLSVVFAPVTLATPASDTLTFSSNAVNAAPISEILSGTVTNLSTTTTTLALIAPASGNPAYGQPITVGATVVSSKVGFTPTGVVTFFVDGIARPAVALSTSSPYVAQVIVTGLTAGVHTINAVYGGDANNASSSNATPLTVTVSKLASTVTLAGYPVATVSQVAGSTVTFTATVKVASGVPTGTISLVLAGTSTVLASGPVQASTGTVPVYTTVLAYVPPATGSYQVVYSGDGNFLGATSNAAVVSIAPQDFSVSLSSSTLTVVPGRSASTTVTVTSISGYGGTVTVGALDIFTGVVTNPCSSLPQYVTCSFAPGAVAMSSSTSTYPAANVTQTFALTLNTNVPPAQPFPSPTGAMVWPVGLVALMLAVRKRRSAVRMRLMAVLSCVALGALALGAGGCGSGSPYMTPAGTTPVTLTLSGSTAPANTSVNSPIAPGYDPTKPSYPNITHAVTLTLTVQ